jgi:3-oxoacyl-[acyl-carrier protein] reductase
VSFEGQAVVVTGGTRGLGKAITLDFLERGARVCATYQGNETAAEAMREECARISHFDGRLSLHRFDVADYSAVEAFWGELDELVPDGIQVLVNNAGLRRDALLAMLPPEDWTRVIETNLTGNYHMSKFGVLNMLRARYGRIVMITSPAGSHGFEGQANYSASKAGQVGLMRSLAREVAKRGITVNCVSPGFVDTELLADLPDELKKAHKASVPMKRFGTPAEVAYAVRCLAAREASYINGTTLEVTGGL